MTGGKKKRAKLAPKDFVDVERRDRMEMSDTDILDFREMVKLEMVPARAIPAR